MKEGRKPLGWLHGEIKTPPFSAEARVEAGCLLGRLQRGELLAMPYSRPMPSIGARCYELRVKDARAEWRIIYRIDQDAILVEMKLTLAKTLEETRKQKGLTQKTLADKLHTSQPRVAMMEKGDPSVSLDRLIRALLILGIPAKETGLSDMIGQAGLTCQKAQRPDPLKP